MVGYHFHWPILNHAKRFAKWLMSIRSHRPDFPRLSATWRSNNAIAFSSVLSGLWLFIVGMVGLIIGSTIDPAPPQGQDIYVINSPFHITTVGVVFSIAAVPAAFVVMWMLSRIAYIVVPATVSGTARGGIALGRGAKTLGYQFVPRIEKEIIRVDREYTTKLEDETGIYKEIDHG